VAAYFGPPSPLRGAPLLLQAAALARRELPALKLLVLSRQRRGEPQRDALQLKHMLKTDHLRGIHPPGERHPARRGIGKLRGRLRPCRPALRAGALRCPPGSPRGPRPGLPLVTTRLACLPEQAQGGRHALAEPGDIGSLAAALLRATTQLRQLPPHDPAPAPRLGRLWAKSGNDTCSRCNLLETPCQLWIYHPLLSRGAGQALASALYPAFRRPGHRLLAPAFLNPVKDLPLPEFRTVLDAGCGRGAFTFWLAQNFPMPFTTPAISPRAISRCVGASKTLRGPLPFFCTGFGGILPARYLRFHLSNHVPGTHPPEHGSHHEIM